MVPTHIHGEHTNEIPDDDFDLGFGRDVSQNNFHPKPATFIVRYEAPPRV